MGGSLYRFFLSIGIGLGLVAGQVDPLVAARVLRQTPAAAGAPTLIVVEVRVADAFSAGSRDLVVTGSTVALRVEARLLPREGAGREGRATRSLSWDPRTARYRVRLDDEGREVLLADAEAAITLASSFPSLPLGPAEALEAGGRVIVGARIGLIDSAGAFHDAPVLWNYVKPEAAFSFASSSEVPY